jgi:hypothetical protein
VIRIGSGPPVKKEIYFNIENYFPFNAEQKIIQKK